MKLHKSTMFCTTLLLLLSSLAAYTHAEQQYCPGPDQTARTHHEYAGIQPVVDVPDSSHPYAVERTVVIPAGGGQDDRDGSAGPEEGDNATDAADGEADATVSQDSSALTQDDEELVYDEYTPPPSIPVFRLSGLWRESPPPFELGAAAGRAKTITNLVQRVNQAAADDTVETVVLLVDDVQFGWAQAQEIAQAVERLRRAGKIVRCHFDEITTLAYLAVAPCDELAMTATGSIDIVGIHAQMLFLKDLMDKVGVQADIEHIGRYKGAGEPFTRTSPSEYMAEQMNWLVDDMYAQMLQTIAAGRGLTEMRVRQIIDDGPYMADSAEQADLVDRVCHREDFLDSIAPDATEETFDYEYGLASLPSADMSSMMGIMTFLGQLTSPEAGDKDARIAVIHVEGMIVMGESEEGFFGERVAGAQTLREAFAEAADDPNVRGAVLRIDSPGGSVTASEIIWRAASAFASEKQLVVSMGNTAASGGYYVACAASAIFAEPATVTGSIGVVGGKTVVGDLYDKLGLSVTSFTRGRNADIFDSTAMFTDRQRDKIRHMMQHAYERFTSHVQKARKDTIDDIDAVAGGRVFTGRQAEQLGLVDTVGGLDAAIAQVADELSLDEYDIVSYPRPKSFGEVLMEMLGVESGQVSACGMATIAANQANGPGGITATIVDWVRIVDALDPALGSGIRGMLRAGYMLRDEQVLAVMPFTLSWR